MKNKMYIFNNIQFKCQQPFKNYARLLDENNF